MRRTTADYVEEGLRAEREAADRVARRAPDLGVLPLLGPVRPPSLLARGIDLRCCDCAAPSWLDDCDGATLAIVDPPWTYRGGSAVLAEASEASGVYPTLSTARIVELVAALPAPAIAVWCTWPLLGEWTAASAAALPPLRSGGAWTKSGPGDSGHYGPGRWWAGCSEPVLLYGRADQDGAAPLRNAWIDPPGAHSRKPVGWMRQWLRRWTDPGDLVIDPFAGLGAVAEACLLEGRRYLGAEIDPERHAAALSLLAQVRA